MFLYFSKKKKRNLLLSKTLVIKTVYHYICVCSIYTHMYASKYDYPTWWYKNLDLNRTI